MEEHEFTLRDRIGVIQNAEKRFRISENAYISFSGGKDSTVLSALIDLALPENQIPRVFVDTGIEYNAIRAFVSKLCEKDARFVKITTKKPIKKILETYGYPFKSKEHSHILSCYQHSGFSKSVNMYLSREGNKLITCPKALEYQFGQDFHLKVSDQCCLRMKKEPFKQFQRDAKKSVAITGIRHGEGGKERL